MNIEQINNEGRPLGVANKQSYSCSFRISEDGTKEILDAGINGTITIDPIVKEKSLTHITQHEILHILGFNHVADITDIMYPYYFSFQTNHQDNIDFLNEKYPGNEDELKEKIQPEFEDEELEMGY